MDGQRNTGYLPTNGRKRIMGNMRHRVNMVLVTCLLIGMSAHATSSSDLYVLHSLERSSDTHQKDSNERVGFGNSHDHLQGRNSVKFHRKLLIESVEYTQKANTEVNSIWPSVLGALTAALCVGLLIAVAVKYRLFQCCLVRNSHDLLLEGDTASQFSQPGALEGGIPVHDMRGRIMLASGDSSDDDNDDDGFIEDNYIEQSEREKAEKEETHHEDIEDSDDELIISDII
ncbi:uncharacterized protein LOC127442491 isoform X2 [Myxocyprinus asiaticus]|uniref:uncharacterized protein LOC127442491 isoform X2 n=1 Tax=Myxocyprinus asiaticus TaxID=70543 RepID=UPI002222EE57|nr:uncharacterized protein LOC127442491 isoform X2 [Myxocyprinus asiaticus]